MDDFKQFFVRGLAALLPTLITLWLLIKLWNFLWDSLGQHMIWAWAALSRWELIPYQDRFRDLQLPAWLVQIIGVALAVFFVYCVGLLVGNLIGRTLWRLMELLVLRVPLVRAIYPAVKQVTDFVLTDRKGRFEASRVVAVQPHEKGIWSIGLVTGTGLKPLSESLQSEMVTVFVPSTPTAFTGYVLIVPRHSVVELPMSVEEAMRLLVSGGVIEPDASKQGLPPTAEPRPMPGQEVQTFPKA